MTTYDPRLLQSYYDQFYYDTYAFGQSYDAGNPHWRQLFDGFAEAIVSELAPRTSLDLGCGPGLLVEALRRRGVDARGIDISEHAIEHAAEGAREFCRVGSVTDPIEERFDLIVCIEVLEHVPREYADSAVAQMASHARQVLFSSSPDDFKDPSHTNVQPTEYWIGLFGRHGMYRDLDFDASFISPQAICFHQPDSVLQVIRAYERRYFRLTQELREVREANVAIVADRATLTAQLQEAQGNASALSRTWPRRFASRILPAPLKRAIRRLAPRA
jgi:2-polyprenyl-3-methyl-5-hydroxy-6-metoxy-1,4-benzoquinol methylase